MSGMALAVLMGLLACTREETIDPLHSDGSHNFPWLQVGHELHYVYDFSNGADSLIIRILSSPAPGTYKAEMRYAPSGISQVLYYHANGKQLYTSTNGNYLQYDHWWFSLEANVGDFWSRNTPGILYTYQLEGIHKRVETPQLKRIYEDCYQISAKNPFGNGIDTIYFKPGSGIVYYDGADGHYELARTNFSIPNP